MDTLTHALSGALLARATEPAHPRPGQLPRRVRMWVGFWAAAFPDGDFVLNFIDPLTYLTTHRGITHSLVLLPLWALGLAWLCARCARRRYPVRAFTGVCALGIGTHIAGDVITAFGTMVFAPLSDVRVAWPTTFIIDPYFSLIIVAGLIAAALWQRARAPALTALAVLGIYVGLQGVLQARALDVGAAYAASRGLADAPVAAVPQPFSPFHWLVVVQEPDAYRLAYISLARAQAPAPPPADASWWRRLYASYYPPVQAPWTRIPRFGSDAAHARIARALWEADTLAAYRRFALFPALYRVDQRGSRMCVWFNDLRFALAGRDMPFRYGACREDAGPWRLRRLTEDEPLALERLPH